MSDDGRLRRARGERPQIRRPRADRRSPHRRRRRAARPSGAARTSARRETRCRARRVCAARRARTGASSARRSSTTIGSVVTASGDGRLAAAETEVRTAMRLAVMVRSGPRTRCVSRERDTVTRSPKIVRIAQSGIAIAHIVHTCTQTGTLNAAAVAVATVPPKPGMTANGDARKAGEPTGKRLTHGGRRCRYSCKSSSCEAR